MCESGNVQLIQLMIVVTVKKNCLPANYLGVVGRQRA